jgi:hypothetical protein
VNRFRVSAIAGWVLASLVAAAGAHAAKLPAQWDPARVAVSPEGDFLLRPGQILAASRDAGDVARVLAGSGWKPADTRAPGITVFRKAPGAPETAAREVLAALAKVREATARRKHGPARVAPNHVLVGESAPITFTGEPRIQGGPGSSVRFAAPPGALPSRNALPGDGQDAHVAVLDTGLFEHEWLGAVERAPGADDVWDVEGDDYGDNQAGHGTFIAGLIRQVAPAATVHAVKVLDSHGVGDDLGVAAAMGRLPADVDVVNLSLGGYTEGDAPPMAIAEAMRAPAFRTRVVLAAAGNHGAARPFWPAAFEPVVAVGAVEPDAGAWTPASYSNHGAWVDLVARGTGLQSAFAHATTRVALGPVTARSDPWLTFEGWAEWDGTSFATPIAAAMVARTMTRAGTPHASLAAEQLELASATPGLAVFPNAHVIDELR